MFKVNTSGEATNLAVDDIILFETQEGIKGAIKILSTSKMLTNITFDVKLIK